MSRRSLGQHYLVDLSVIQRIVQAAAIKPSERVLEIGTGKGALTRELAGAGASFVGYEIDRVNLEQTREAVRGSPARLIRADAFEANPAFDVLVASLPYSRSASFIGWLSDIGFSRAVVVLQEDFVRKIMAPPGRRDYRGISALAQLAFELETVERVPRQAFSPPPKVGSAVLSIRPRLRVPKDEASRIMKLFSLRRRRVDSALSTLSMVRGRKYGERRVYTLSPEEVHELCRSDAQWRLYDVLKRAS